MNRAVRAITNKVQLTLSQTKSCVLSPERHNWQVPDPGERVSVGVGVWPAGIWK